MKDLKTVMAFTIKDMIKRKSFVVSTIIIILIIIIGLNIPNIIKLFSDDSSSSGNTRLLVVDSTNLFENKLNELTNMNLGYEVNSTEQNLGYDDIKAKIENDEIDEAILVEKNNKNYKLRYIVKDMTMVNSMPKELINAINTVYTNLQISKLDLTDEQMQSLTPKFEYSIEQTEEQKVNGNIFAMLMLSIVLFYAIYFCAYQVSSSITTEKTSKIMETLVTSTSPRTIVLGKTIGIGIVGLLQVCLFVIVALVSAKVCLEPEILNMSMMTPYLAIITIVYFVLGYSTYALLYALTGSTVGKPEDIQSANTPVAILAVIGFYLSYFTMMNPTSDLNLFASIFPISSPFCMPFRVMMGIANGGEVALSLAILIVTILIIAKVAIKIYSNAILNYGTKMSLKDMIKIYKDKNN